GLPGFVTSAGVTEVRVRDMAEPACTVKDGRTLTREGFVVDEAVGTRRVDGLFVQAHRVKVTAFDPRDFGAHQRGAVFEILRAILGPDFDLSMVHSKSFQVLRAFCGAGGFAARSTRQCAVIMVFSLLENTARGPEQPLRVRCSGHCLLVVTGKIARL